jgi:CMP/dCMP kinase
VVCPHARVKIFVTATPKVRAHRRALEFRARGETISEADVLADVLRRDRRDSSRTVAPLTPAADARVLDTTALDADGTYREAVRLIDELRRAGS